MYFYVFRMVKVSIDKGLDWLNQMRQDFPHVEIKEFEWAEYDFYITFLASSDVARQMFTKYPGVEKYDRWEIPVRR